MMPRKPGRIRSRCIGAEIFWRVTCKGCVSLGLQIRRALRVGYVMPQTSKGPPVIATPMLNSISMDTYTWTWPTQLSVSDVNRLYMICQMTLKSMGPRCRPQE